MGQGNIGGRGQKGGTSGASGIEIDIQNPSDLKHWSEELHCSADQLRVAIYKVGCKVDAVRKYINSLKHD